MTKTFPALGGLEVTTDVIVVVDVEEVAPASVVVVADEPQAQEQVLCGACKTAPGETE